MMENKENINCKHCYLSGVCNEYDELKRLFEKHHTDFLNTNQRETLLRILAKCCVNYKE